MAIKIQTKTNYIPIEIGDLEIKFKVTDENIDRLYNGYDEMLKKHKNVEVDSAEKGKMILKDAIDYIFEDGTFDKIYALSESVLITQQYFEAIVNGLEKELENRFKTSKQENVQKYLQNKKKKNEQKSKKK